MRYVSILLALPVLAACGDTAETSCENFCELATSCAVVCDPNVPQCVALSLGGLGREECVSTCTDNLNSLPKTCRDEAVGYNTCLASLTCDEFQTIAGLEKCSDESMAVHDRCHGEE